MENFYLILVVILFALAISDLIVGVSNDAVNFLNSAIGSKAAPKWLIFSVASLGILIGATFSSGMMEVARKGIFHPDMFFFSEIMVIFLAVMITDVVLLDVFNTFGMPTSTTVSIVFELLGSAVAVSLVKISQADGTALELSKYINSDKALAIISGILVSVVIAFTFGVAIQYLARFLFSFRYEKPLKYFGSIFGGLAITSITYFILIKGVEGSSFAEWKMANGEFLEDWVANHSGKILIYSLIGWTVLIQLLSWVFHIKILKVIVLVGTFALAMAFAGNDLVNFIGVPIAGFKSFQAWIGSGHPAPDSYTMEMLTGNVDTPSYMLVLAGIVMIITLIFSKKARSVVSTTVDLSRQTEGTERFGSSMVARLIVRSSVKANKTVKGLLPSAMNRLIEKRFTPIPLGPSNDPETPAFDKIRAAVNLVVASILISFGTSLKLPLSTTYVTFMVAMGTSLADRAWDRESAVYRISGVIAVIGGWFLTAIIAFTIAGLIALAISLGGNLIIFIMIGVAIFLVVRTHIFFKKRNSKRKEEDEELANENDANEQIIVKSNKQVISALIASNQIYSLGIDGFLKEDRAKLKNAFQESIEFSQKSKKQKARVYSTIQLLIEGTIETSHFYVQMTDYKREMAHSLYFLLDPLEIHLENQHKPFNKEQSGEMKALITQIDEFFNLSLYIAKEERFNELDNLIGKREKLFETLNKLEKNQIKRIKNKDVSTRNSQLFFKIISETKNLLLHSVNLLKSQRDFNIFTRQPAQD